MGQQTTRTLTTLTHQVVASQERTSQPTSTQGSGASPKLWLAARQTSLLLTKRTAPVATSWAGLTALLGGRPPWVGLAQPCGCSRYDQLSSAAEFGGKVPVASRVDPLCIHCRTPGRGPPSILQGSLHLWARHERICSLLLAQSVHCHRSLGLSLARCPAGTSWACDE